MLGQLGVSTVLVSALCVLFASVSAEPEKPIANDKSSQSIGENGDLVASLIRPVILNDFFDSVWERAPHHFQHGQGSNGDGDQGGAEKDNRHSSRPSPSSRAPCILSGLTLDTLLHHYAPLFREQGKAGNVDVRLNGTRMALNASSDSDSPASFLSSRALMALLEEGKSLIFRLEHLALPDADPVARLATAVTDVFGLPASLHAYVSGPSQSALQPHSDPYDVFVAQVAGSKAWTVRGVRRT